MGNTVLSVTKQPYSNFACGLLRARLVLPPNWRLRVARVGYAAVEGDLSRLSREEMQRTAGEMLAVVCRCGGRLVMTNS